MEIHSSRVKKTTPAARQFVAPNSDSIAGVMLAAPEMTFRPRSERHGTSAHVAEGIYVFPTKPDRSDPVGAAMLGAQVSSVLKLITEQLGTAVHPHLGTGVRAGWIAVGAMSLFNRAKAGELAWHQVALEGGGLAVDALLAADDAIAGDTRLGGDWAEGVGFLLEAAKDACDGGDTNQFVMDKVIDQSLPAACTHKLLSLALASQSPADEFSALKATPMKVQVR